MLRAVTAIAVTCAVAAACASSAVAIEGHAARSCGRIYPKAIATLLPPYNAAKIRTHGKVSCTTAKRTMTILFRHGGNTETTVHGWDCVGPQTGYAKCTRGNASITATF